MIVISHRLNGFDYENRVKHAEVDIYIDSTGEVVVGHNPDDDFMHIHQYLNGNSHVESFFVDIKQNMDVSYLNQIGLKFKDKLIGIFDVPMPSVYFASNLDLPIYLRVSEYEPFNNDFSRIWLDPLGSHNPSIYENLINELPLDTDIRIIAACPSLHGKSLEECKRVWNFLKSNNIQGIVTKYVRECERYLDD